MERVACMLPRERHPNVPFFVSLRLDPGFGVSGHQSAQACALLHPDCKKLPLQLVNLPRDHSMLVSRSPVAPYLCLERWITEATYRSIHFGLVVVFGVEILGVFGGVAGLLPGVGVGSRLNLGDESGAGRRHLPVGVGVVVVQEELNVLSGNLSSRLIVD